MREGGDGEEERDRWWEKGGKKDKGEIGKGGEMEHEEMKEEGVWLEEKYSN